MMYKCVQYQAVKLPYRAAAVERRYQGKLAVGWKKHRLGV